MKWLAMSLRYAEAPKKSRATKPRARKKAAPRRAPAASKLPTELEEEEQQMGSSRISPQGIGLDTLDNDEAPPETAEEVDADN